MRRAYLIAVLLLLAASVSAQGRTASTLRSIDRYVRSLDKITKLRKEPDLITADTADSDADKPAWRRFASPAALEKARGEKETYTIAYNWKNQGRIVVSNFTYFSESGDWAQYVFHYFRRGGTLARVDAELRTFNENCVIKQRLYFDRRGKRIRKTLSYYGLATDKKRKQCLGADALKFDYYRSTSRLPFH